MAHILDECLDSIYKIFRESSNKYEAHLKCNPILYRMAKEDEIIFEVFRRNMAKPNFFNKKLCTPDFQLTLMDHPECFMFVNFFGPNQEGRTDVSYSTMHHHDDYLLSTINAKGIGYNSLIFKQGYEIDKDKMEARVDLEKYVLHAENHIEFIDCHTAHTLFYPKSMTMTYGLWSTFYPTSQMTKFKNSGFVQVNKQKIKDLMTTVGINPRKLGVAQYREDYFCPENGKLKFLSGQVAPEYGKHFAQNFFNIAQDFLKFDDKRFLKDVHSQKKSDAIEGENTQWIERAIENETIERNYDSYNMYTPLRNVPQEEYKKVYEF